MVFNITVVARADLQSPLSLNNSFSNPFPPDLQMSGVTCHVSSVTIFFDKVIIFYRIEIINLC